jgi:hypothetical protein
MRAPDYYSLVREKIGPRRIAINFFPAQDSLRSPDPLFDAKRVYPSSPYGFDLAMPFA